jgi:hypothetical protein
VTTLTSGAFSTTSASELICVTSAQQGSGLTGVTVTDSGISKSVGWTLIKSCTHSTRTYAALHCAVTSALVSAQTVTVTCAGSPTVGSSVLEVHPFFSSQLALPTNSVCATGASGVAAISITPSGAGSGILMAGSNGANNTNATPITSPYFSYIGPQRSLFSPAGNAWLQAFSAQVASALTAGTTAPTITDWALAGMEVMVSDPSSSSVPSRSRTGSGAWLEPSPPLTPAMLAQEQ